MKKVFAILATVGLAACSSSVLVTNQQLTEAITKLGYTKVLIQPKNLNCGRFGKGKHFIATNQSKQAVIGQICYFKGKNGVDYKVDINKTL